MWEQKGNEGENSCPCAQGESTELGEEQTTQSRIFSPYVTEDSSSKIIIVIALQRVLEWGDE